VSSRRGEESRFQRAPAALPLLKAEDRNKHIDSSALKRSISLLGLHLDCLCIFPCGIARTSSLSRSASASNNPLNIYPVVDRTTASKCDWLLNSLTAPPAQTLASQYCPVRSSRDRLGHVSTPARVAAPACTNLPNRNQMRKKQTKLDNTLRPGGYYAPSTKPSGFNMILASSTISKRIRSEGISTGEL
jgi:hypothetical protein